MQKKSKFVFALVLCCGGWGLLQVPGYAEKAASKPTAAKPKQRARAAKVGVAKAKIWHRGIIQCFPTGLKRKKGKLANCETSAVVYDGREVFVASDKRIPGRLRSSVLRLPLTLTYKGPSLGLVRYMLHKGIKKAKKFEDASLSPDGRFVFLSTGFDRVRKDGRWDRYNRLFYWPTGRAKEARLFVASRRDPKTGKIPLRTMLRKALANTEFPKGAPYFKIEGLAAIPGNKLLFGVREWGHHYRAFYYSIKLIAISYERRGEILHLKDDARLIYDFSTRARKIVRRTVALSSIEYDRFHKRLLLLTSYETSETARGLGAFLWSMPLSAIKTNQPPTLFRTPKGKPLHFAHKAEAVTVIDKNYILVFHDDDRVFGNKLIKDPTKDFFRARHQAAYTFIKRTP